MADDDAAPESFPAPPLGNGRSVRRRGAGRPTLDTVARHAGVGRGTVSRVINGSPKVAEDTRAAVLAAIAELGYVPNQAARTLVTQRTDTVALVVTESQEWLWSEPFFAGVLRGITEQLAEENMRLMLTFAPRDGNRSDLEAYLMGHHVDGVMMVSSHGGDPLPERLEDAGVPIVLCGLPVGLRPVAYVDCDNRSGARQAVEYLAEKGHQRIGIISGPQDMAVGVDRLNGYRDGLRGHRLPVEENLVSYAEGFDEASGIKAARQLFDTAGELDAVFAASDPLAIATLRVARERGITVPDDLALIGFDDSPLAEVSEPPLTTVHQPTETMGREMARLLCGRVRGEEDGPLVTILGTRIIVRESA
ncbi:LacI family DNA-binding transcriptional regulator [Glycomyces buryatensis]|uniref:LacI family transcriptional regulator n=1 Tax=Glycomyces buryatensis TaxID=2570927 RepID=A0A4S8Q931_9ACTN|nr:LacI family DNA-binding transcriptional regulator [Glycomyces buryatensis]THV40927.1 LacI family transcriptional regulator [Glycomyces buryatensis]